MLHFYIDETVSDTLFGFENGFDYPVTIGASADETVERKFRRIRKNAIVSRASIKSYQ